MSPACPSSVAAKRAASKAATPRVGTVKWPLALTGRTETVFFWKNGMQTLRGTNLMAVLPFLLPLAVIIVVGATARMSATGSRGPAAAFATGSLFLAVFWTLMGPQGQRLILFGGVMLALIVMVGPGAIAGALIAFVFYRFVGMVSLVPAAVVCLA
ncbi:MAG: hypothetical protein Q7R30_03510, partial [Acidobacteriota bacterium]|nr:hypothetical protein [Acidobacteriota bacterium]